MDQPDAGIVREHRVVANDIVPEACLECGRRRFGEREDWVGRMRHEAQSNARFLVALERHVFNNVVGRAGVEHHAVVELHDRPVLDRDKVIAVIADTGGDTFAVDSMAVQVDSDAWSADDKTIPETVKQVISDFDALGDHLPAEDGGGHRRAADRPQVRDRCRIDIAGCVLRLYDELVRANGKSAQHQWRGAGLEWRIVQRAFKGRSWVIAGEGKCRSGKSCHRVWRRVEEGIWRDDIRRRKHNRPGVCGWCGVHVWCGFAKVNGADLEGMRATAQGIFLG